MKFHFWNIIFLLFFVVIAVLSYLWLAANGRLSMSVPLIDFFLMALAVQRLVQLFTYDVVIGFVRHWFVGADPYSLLGTFGALIRCPWCTGLWFALFVIFFYFTTPIAWYAILVLALSSIASFLQILVNLIGWSAEVKKKKAQSSVPIGK